MVNPSGSSSPSLEVHSAQMVDEAASNALMSTCDSQADAGKVRVVVVHGDPHRPGSALPNGKWDEDDFEVQNQLLAALNQIEGYSFSLLCNHSTLMDDLRRLKSQNKVDLVLQFCDDGWENHNRMELHVCAYLEMLHIPYTGTGPATIGVTFDKEAVLQMAASIGIPVPKTVYIENEKNGIDIKGLRYPVLVKPNSTDGSFGITRKSVCRNEQDLREAISHIRSVFGVYGAVLVQEYLEGRDLNCGIIGNPPYAHTLLPITEEDYTAVPEGWPKICGFESKWDPESPYYNIKTVPTTISEEKKQLIADCSRRLFHRLNIRDYCRFDWRLDADGNPHLLEANPNCGWGNDGHMAKTCAVGGYSYSDMIRMIIEAARNRDKMPKDPELKWIDVARVREEINK